MKYSSRYDSKKIFLIFLILFSLFVVSQITKSFFLGKPISYESDLFRYDSKKNRSNSNAKVHTLTGEQRTFYEKRKIQKNFFKKIEDSIGQNDFSLAINKIVSEAIKNLVTEPNQENLQFCNQRMNCPFDLVQLYSLAFESLNLEHFANVKVLLQDSMLATDLQAEQKIQFLIQELTSPNISSLQESSFRDEFGKPHISDEILYLLATQNKLLHLNRDFRSSAQASLFAIQNIQDRVGRVLLASSLLQSFPEFRFEVELELERIGLDPILISKL